MRLQEIVDITGARPLCSQPDLNREVSCAFASDLMSDVLRFDLSQGLLITGLANPQVVRTAEMADATAILMVRGKTPPTETLYLAEQVGIPILGTNFIMFETCGRLYEAGLRACIGHNGDITPAR